MPRKIDGKHVGQDFDEFLAEEGIAGEVEARAIMKVVVALLEKYGIDAGRTGRAPAYQPYAGSPLARFGQRLHHASTLQHAADVTRHRLVVALNLCAGQPVYLPDLGRRACPTTSRLFGISIPIVVWLRQPLPNTD